LIDPKLPVALLMFRKSVIFVRSSQVPMSLADADSSSARHQQQAECGSFPAVRFAWDRTSLRDRLD
jgi:hypothetical protein